MCVWSQAVPFGPAGAERRGGAEGAWPLKALLAGCAPSPGETRTSVPQACGISSP